MPDLSYGHGPGGLNDLTLTSPDGSCTRHSPDGDLHQVGPRPLWDGIETIHDRWRHWGNPHRERFGLTITETNQRVWLDEPPNVISP